MWKISCAKRYKAANYSFNLDPLSCLQKSSKWAKRRRDTAVGYHEMDNMPGHQDFVLTCAYER